MRNPPLTALAAAAFVALCVPHAADARPSGYYGGGYGAAWSVGYRPGWGSVYYRPGWPAWYGWGAYRAPYYRGYYGYGLAAGAALGWSLANPWWPAGGAAWYGLPAAYSYDPYAGVAVALPAPPVELTYIQQPQVAAAEPARPAAQGHWYYCKAPAGYYPTVTSCSQPWIAVTSQTSGSESGGDASRP